MAVMIDMSKSRNQDIQYVRLIDLSKCIGCGACESACEFVHNGITYIKVYRSDIGIETPLSCLHCDKAPCIDSCPTEALIRDSSGAVIVIPDKCIGCRNCMIACPFGIPVYNVQLSSVTKCDLCRDLRARGLEPACYAICPTGAIVVNKWEEILGSKK